MTEVGLIAFKQVLHLNLNLAVGVLLAWIFLGRKAGPRTCALVWGFLLVRLLLEPILWLESAELPPLDWEQQGFISLGIGAPTTLVALLGLGSSSFSVGDIAQFCFGDQTCSLFGLLLVMGMLVSIASRLFHLSRHLGSGAGEVLWTTEAVSPSLDGWWRPAIRMPERLRGELEDDELAAVLAHEQAHLRRKDHLLFALLYLLRGLSWCIWPIAIIANSLEESVERLCDRAAASQTHPRR